MSSGPVAGQVGPAAVGPVTLDLVEGGGLLELRDQEPAELQMPTSMSAQYDDETGALTDGELSTPVISFEQEVTDPITTTVFIDAVFSNASGAAGIIDFSGNVVVEATLIADLHIEVGNPALILSDCRAAPIQLILESIEPYNPSTGRVTLSDQNFSIPEVGNVPGAGAACDSTLIKPEIDSQLAGSGHALTLTLEGDLPLPPEPGEPSTTSLQIDPENVSLLAEPVTMSATVEPEVVGTTDVPTGFVDFRSDGTTLATVSLVNGEAEFTTSELTIGEHALSAHYRGDATFAPSSDGKQHTVEAIPLVSADLPQFVTYGAQPVEFDVTIVNTPLGSSIENALIDFTISRAQGTGAFTADRVSLEYLDQGDVWQPVGLTQIATRTQNGHIGPATGFELPIGVEASQRLRLAFPDVGGTWSPTSCLSSRPTCPGPFRVTFDVLLVDPADGTPMGLLASGSGETMLVEAERRTPTLTITGGAPRPHTVRQGTTARLQVSPGPTFAGITPTGQMAFLIDGVPTLFRGASTPIADGWPSDTVEFAGGVTVHEVMIPLDMPVGTRQLTVVYSGDALHEPAQTTAELHVLPRSSGTHFECTNETHLVSVFRTGAMLSANANFPTVVASGAEVPLASFNLNLKMSRPTTVTQDPLTAIPNDAITAVGDPIGHPITPGAIQDVSVHLGTGDVLDATALERRNASPLPSDPNPAGPTDVDHGLIVHGTEGSVTITGAPGEVVPVTVERVGVDWIETSDFPVQYEFRCAPVGEAHLLRQVTVAGTLLSASTSSPQSGQDVTLTAEALPEAPGIMVFKNGAETIGVIPTDNGTASLTVSNLAIGSHEITAQFFPTSLGIPSTTSDPVTVTVIDMDPAFSDVPEDSPFFDAIQWLDQEGITTGFPDGTFQPAAAISRDAVAAWLWRYAGEPVVDIEQQFSDVPPEHPFYAAIQWMGDAGITTGFPDGTFQPASPIARDAVAAWLWRFAGEPEPTLEEPAFSDVPADHPFYEAVQWLAETEVTTGFPDGSFQPAAQIERQAVAAWLFRLAQL